MTTKTIHAPWVNLVTVTMMSTLKVMTAPTALMARPRQTAPRSSRAATQDPEPVPDHAGLPERERHEDADDVELDERGDVGLEHDQDDDGRDRQRDDAVREDQPVAAGGERLRRVAVGREHRAEQREPVERRVRREQQHRRGRRLDDEERDRVVAERGRRDLRDQAALRVVAVAAVGELDELGAVDVVHAAPCRATTTRPENSTIAIAAHRHQRLLRVLDLRAAERGHAVRDRLDAGERGASAREGAQQQQDERRLASGSRPAPRARRSRRSARRRRAARTR